MDISVKRLRRTSLVVARADYGLRVKAVVDWRDAERICSMVVWVAKDVLVRDWEGDGNGGFGTVLFGGSSLLHVTGGFYP